MYYLYIKFEPNTLTKWFNENFSQNHLIFFVDTNTLK